MSFGGTATFWLEGKPKGKHLDPSDHVTQSQAASSWPSSASNLTRRCVFACESRKPKAQPLVSHCGPHVFRIAKGASFPSLWPGLLMSHVHSLRGFAPISVLLFHWAQQLRPGAKRRRNGNTETTRASASKSCKSCPQPAGQPAFSHRNSCTLPKKLDHGWPESRTSQARSAQRCRMRSFSLHEAFAKQARDSTSKVLCANWSVQVGLRKLLYASCTVQVALRKLLRASCSGKLVPASGSLQVALCKLRSLQVALCKLLCASCSVQVALRKLLCASCSRQGALRKLVGASWSAQVALCNLLCASCSAQVA